ncbi:MAG TPA: alpha/beta hydrolase [Caldimonas sp.]|nr:alpha/beta hydrolase [Caldimonas sp.]
MIPPRRTVLSDVRGAAKLTFDAALGVVDIVERMHRTIGARPSPWGEAPRDRTSGITGRVYQAVRGGVRLAGRGLDASLGGAARLLPDADSGPRLDALVAAVNGVYGDHLARSGNPLATEMSLRFQGRAIDVARPADSVVAATGKPATGRLLILVHGLCMSDLQWRRHGHDHGEALAEDPGRTVLYLRYNSGLHIGANGRAFSALLETLVARWPCALDDLSIVGHSMGGLVARSACFYAAEKRHAWPQRLRKLVFLGTPHHGSPLERGGRRIDQVLDLSPYSAPLSRLGKSRSAGIRDLRHGTITTGGPDFVPLPEGVECYAAAATLAARRGLLAERLVGDGLVPLDSALGRHRDAARTLAFATSHQWISYETGHLDLLWRPEVLSRLRTWLE